MTEMWNIRESCNPSVAQAGCVYKFDVSIPIEDYMDTAWEVKRLLGSTIDTPITHCSVSSNASAFTVCVWGHIADGNAHINIVTPGQFKRDHALAKHIETLVYESVLKRKGSISAEHGLGQSKNQYLAKIKEKGVLEVMMKLKDVFDPHGIMNPCKYLPQDGV